MEFFAIIGILAIAIFFWQRLKAWRDDHLGPSEPEETEDINEPPELTDSIARLYNRQSRFFHPDFQFDLSTPMSDRFQNANKLPYIKTFDTLISAAKDTLNYLHDIVFVKITYSDLTVPVRWLMERDEAELSLKYTLGKAAKAYELYQQEDTKPQTTEIRKLSNEATKHVKELQRIEAAIRDLLAVKSPQDRPLSPKAPE
ncbi:hypothetical protein IJG98_00595 [Candidatus Saccharibacteria bacterium]|nr:hypothetical protein [Candidatus Saccharibacteria bacterium]